MSHATEADPIQTGVALFNSQQYWHAHEVWEQGWLGASEPQATLYKGLIQTAAALVHWQRGNPKGLQLNWAKARPKLLAVPQGITPLDLTELIKAMDEFVTHSYGRTDVSAPVNHAYEPTDVPAPADPPYGPTDVSAPAQPPSITYAS